MYAGRELGDVVAEWKWRPYICSVMPALGGYARHSQSLDADELLDYISHVPMQHLERFAPRPRLSTNLYLDKR